MKITWFGGTTVRVHIGGIIFVVGSEGVPQGIDPAELVSGADRVIPSHGTELSTVDLTAWRPQRAGRLMDEGASAVEAWSGGAGCLLLEAVGEAPLLLVSGQLPALGRWADQAVVLLMGSDDHLIENGIELLEQASPLLLALASDESAVDSAIAALRDKLDQTGLMALEAGLAVEV